MIINKEQGSLFTDKLLSLSNSQLPGQDLFFKNHYWQKDLLPTTETQWKPNDNVYKTKCIKGQCGRGHKE